MALPHQQYVHWSGSNIQSFQTLLATSPVVQRTSRCSQTPLELSNVLSDSARALSDSAESTCSYGGAFRILRGLTYKLIIFWSSWNLCAHLGDTWRAAVTATQLCGRYREQLRPLHCRRLDALFSQQMFLHNHKAFHLKIFVFVTVTRFATS